MTSIRLKIEESWYASMDCKVQKLGPWVCFYGGHSTGYKLGNHPKNIEPCAHRARTVRAPCAHRATTPPRRLQSAANAICFCAINAWLITRVTYQMMSRNYTVLFLTFRH